jgi:hypothetical protein
LLPSDLSLARICLSSETDASGFDYIDNGADTGVWFGVVKQQGFDIVCFRGSITVEDWMHDVQAEMIAIPGVGLVHAGFAQNILFVKAKIATVSRPNPVVCGHSLGATRAAIYAGLLAARLHDEPQKVALFGCPRPGGHDLVKACENLNITSYKNRNDPVTDVPLPLPDLPYEQVRPFIAIDGMVDYSLPPPFHDHHIINYIKGIENAELKTS